MAARSWKPSLQPMNQQEPERRSRSPSGPLPSGFADVHRPGKRPLFCCRQRLPLAIELVGQISLIVAARAGLRFDDGQKLVHTLQAISVTGLKNIIPQNDDRLGPAEGKL